MPQSVAEVGITTIALGAAIVLCYLFIRRWGTEEGPDALLVLWRRWGELGRPAAPPGRAERPVARTRRADRPRPARRERPGPARRTRADIGARRGKPQAAARETKGKAKPRRAPKPRPATSDIRAARGQRRPAAAKPRPAKTPQPRPTKRKRRKAAPMSTDSGDHMPLGTPRRRRDEAEAPESKVTLRQRFRRGMKRTRDKLGEDVKEAFGAGPTREAFEGIEEALVAADVGIATATSLVEELRENGELTAEELPRALRDVMVSHLEGADRRLRLVRGRVTVWVVAGVNGTGKTTSIAKLAARAQSLGLNVTLAAADTFRAAGIEQLAAWGDRLGVVVVRQKTGADPGAVVFDAIAHARANQHELLIVDTAGRLHTRKPLMDELQKVIRVVERDEGAALAECLLVVDATTGQNGIAQARAFGEAVGVTGLVLAKLDGTAKGGITFAVERELGIPVKAVGIGEKESDLIPFEPRAFVDAILGDA